MDRKVVLIDKVLISNHEFFNPLVNWLNHNGTQFLSYAIPKRLEGGPRRVNHAAVAIGDKIYSFGGYCTGEDYETTRPIDVHVLDTIT